MILLARQFKFEFPRPALVMGILNVTPDSFSDGGHYLQPAAAVEHALAMAGEGADLIDIGGESTRPQSLPVSEAEELRRVLPVLEALQGRLTIPLSIDTLKPAVARAALQVGASLVNDVGANRADPAMWELVAETGAGYVAVHMQGSPQTMQLRPAYDDVVVEVDAFFADRLRRIQAAGVDTAQVILDIGIGFGKTSAHNLQLLAALRRFRRWGRPMLCGASRKSFIGRLTGTAEPADRLPGSLACACWARQEGANIIRTHDVGATRQALRVVEAIIARQSDV